MLKYMCVCVSVECAIYVYEERKREAVIIYTYSFSRQKLAALMLFNTLLPPTLTLYYTLLLVPPHIIYLFYNESVVPTLT